MLPISRAHVKLTPGFVLDLAHCRHACLGFFCGNEGFGGLILQARKFAHFLRNLHRAEVRAAYAAEMGGLGTLCEERLALVLLRRVGVEVGGEHARRVGQFCTVDGSHLPQVLIDFTRAQDAACRRLPLSRRGFRDLPSHSSCAEGGVI